jgi:hypothetical protein
MSAVSGGGGNYISDGAIMAWLAEQQDRIYGDLKGSMDLAETRAKFADELNDIKAGLAEANRNHDFSKVDGQLQAFMDKYADDPNFAETCEGLKGFAGQIHSDYKGVQDYAVANAKYQTELSEYQATAAKAQSGDMEAVIALANHQAQPPKAPDEPVRFYTKDNIDEWTNQISDKLDVSGKNDQLTMIHIQELKATLDQGAQLGSTFISSGDKTSSSIINNIA